MIIIDTHAHPSPCFFEPIEALLFHMNSYRVDKATLVQLSGQTDNRYIIECARRFPGRFSPVVIVDTERTDAPDILKQWVKEGAEGIRLRTTARSPGNDPLAIWRTCADLRLPVSCRAKAEEEYTSDEFCNLIKALPDVAIIIEHLGHAQRDEAPPYSTYRKILALAKYPNTYIKMGGLGEICKRPYPFPLHQSFPFDPVPPFIRMAYEAVGPLRMMWGSDYPPCSHHEGYGNTLRYVIEHLADFCSEEEKQWIFGKTALSLYKFQEGLAKTL